MAVNISLSRFIAELLAAGRRRWLLIIIPIVIFSIFSVIVAKYWPRIYTSTALLMLQENDKWSPLGRQNAPSWDSRLRADEVEALLKSEKLMGAAVLDMQNGSQPLTVTEIDNAVRFWRSALSVKVVGNDFIQIELKDDDPRMLAQRLTIFVSRFLESLLARQENLKGARQFAIQQRELEVKTAERELAAWNSRNPTSFPAPDEATERSGAKEAAAKALAQSRADIEVKAGQILGKVVPYTQLAQAVADARKVIDTARNTSDGKRDTRGSVDPAALEELERSLAEIAARTRQVTETPAKSAKTRDEIAHAQSLSRQRTLLENRLSNAKALLETHRRLLVQGGNATPLGLSAPEQIRVVDEPRVPTFPSNSIFKVILMCLAAGIGIGIGLAVIAEQLDDRMYSVDVIERIVGAPMIARLPSFDGNDVLSPQPGTTGSNVVSTLDRSQDRSIRSAKRSAA